MARTRLGAHRIEAGNFAAIRHNDIRSDSFDEYDDAIEETLDEDTDFDADEDIAFLSEDYDVLELDEVLDLCNVDRRKSLRR